MTIIPVILNISVLMFLLASVLRIDAAEFFCPSGNVTCLIAAINEANQNGQDNTINLEAGIYMLNGVNNNVVGPEGRPDGPNGLPAIHGKVTIRQNEANAVIERDPAAQNFRLFHVEAGGTLNLFGLGLRYGRDQSDAGGGAIFNRGTLTIKSVAIYENTKTTATDPTGMGLRTSGGAAISNRGTASILNSEIARNVVTDDDFLNGLGGAILNLGELTITGSFIYGNRSVSLGGGIFSSNAFLTLTNTAVYENVAEDAGGGLYIQDGSASISNSTIARNQTGGIEIGFADLNVINSTITGNTAAPGFNLDLFAFRTNANFQNSIVGHCIALADSGGTFNSLGHNIIQDDEFCDGHYEPTDMVTNPLLAEWNPDRAYFPLRPDSPAVDAGNPATCPANDQLGLPRIANCDIGAVEFQNGRILVSIDIRPRSDANRINPGSTNNINVAVFSRNGFDANTVDANSVRFGRTGTEAAPINVARGDVDRDGHRDLVVRFQIRDLGIQCGDTSATLTAQTIGGQSIIGSSPITTAGCKQQRQASR